MVLELELVVRVVKGRVTVKRDTALLIQVKCLVSQRSVSHTSQSRNSLLLTVTLTNLIPLVSSGPSKRGGAPVRENDPRRAFCGPVLARFFERGFRLR